MPARAKSPWISRLSGPTYTVSTACSSSNHAIGQAFRLVRDGDAEMAVTGGSEAPFTIGLLKAWEAMRVIAPDTCRPFSKDRRGMVLGEGGAMMILEPLEAAKARGARIYAEICGSGMTSDAHHLTQPTVERARPRHARGPARSRRCGRSKSVISTPTAPARREMTPPRRAPFAKYSARMRTSSRSARPNRCTATRWAQLARSKPSPQSSRCTTASCRPRPTTTSPIPNATSITFPISRAPLESRRRFQIPSLSADLNAVVAFRAHS